VSAPPPLPCALPCLQREANCGKLSEDIMWDTPAPRGRCTPAGSAVETNDGSYEWKGAVQWEGQGHTCGF